MHAFACMSLHMCVLLSVGVHAFVCACVCVLNRGEISSPSRVTLSPATGGLIHKWLYLMTLHHRQ